MASKDRLKDDVRRATLPRLPPPTAVEGAGRLFDWADALSARSRRVLTNPDADWDALVSDFAAVSLDLQRALEVVASAVDRLDPAQRSLIANLVDQSMRNYLDTVFGIHQSRTRRLLKRASTEKGTGDS